MFHVRLLIGYSKVTPLHLKPMGENTFLLREGLNKCLVFGPIGDRDLAICEYSPWRGRGFTVAVGRRRTWRFSDRLISAGEGGRSAEPSFIFTFSFFYFVFCPVLRPQHGDEEEDQPGAEEQKPSGGNCTSADLHLFICRRHEWRMQSPADMTMLKRPFCWWAPTFWPRKQLHDGSNMEEAPAVGTGGARRVQPQPRAHGGFPELTG